MTSSKLAYLFIYKYTTHTHMKHEEQFLVPFPSSSSSFKRILNQNDDRDK